MLVASPASSRATNLSAGLRQPRRMLRRGLLIAISDFLSTEPIGPWRQVSRRGEVIALRIVDPREESLPDAGLVEIEDSETGQHRLVDTSAPSNRALYAAAAADRRRAFRAWCASAQLTPLELPTTEDPIGALLRHFRGRSQRVGARR